MSELKIHDRHSMAYISVSITRNACDWPLTANKTLNNREKRERVNNCNTNNNTDRKYSKKMQKWQSNNEATTITNKDREERQQKGR